MDCELPPVARRNTSVNSPQDRHKAMHFRTSPSPMAWKATYRQKCIQRLRSGREKLLDRFRNINVKIANENIEESMETENGEDETRNLRDLMREEWDLLMKTRSRTESWDFDEQEMMKMMEEVEAELMSEKALIFDEYEKSRALEEAELCAIVDDYLTTSDDDVICPVCMREKLFKPAHNLIACPCCGTRLDFDADVVSMRELKSRLQLAVERHAIQDSTFSNNSIVCQSAPVFTVVTEPTMRCQNLAMICADCDHFEIVV